MVYFKIVIVKTIGKGQGLMLRTLFYRGMTYQTKEKGLIKVSIKFVGGVTMTENLWKSGCCIAFVLVGTVSGVQLQDIKKLLKV
jgi:hypothetical protein